jgi:hypothetical protein
MRSFIKTSSAQKHLERKLEELAESLKEAEAAVAFSRAREAVLCCLISNQEVLQSLLQRLYAWMAGRSVEEAPLGPHLPLFVQQRLSSITRLMSCASSRQIHQAFGMGQCQWSAHKHDHFLRCVSLLELVMRPGVQIDHGKDWGAAAASIVAHAVHARQDCNSNGNNDVAMLSPPLGGPGQAEHGSGNRSGGDGDGGSESPKAAVAGADGNSGAGHSSDGGLARCFMPVMKEALTLNALALLVKPRAILEATLNPDLLYPDPPQGHWMRVLQRMRLTDHQLLLLSLAADEYQRMSAALAQDEVRLAVLVARQSLLLAGEERRAAAAAAAAAAAVSAPTDTVTAAAGPGADGDGKHSPSGRALSVLPGQVTSKAVLHDNDVQRALGEDPRGAEQVDAVLRRHQWQRCVHVVMMSVFFHDTVTPVQLALMASRCVR